MMNVLCQLYGIYCVKLWNFIEARGMRLWNVPPRALSTDFAIQAENAIETQVALLCHTRSRLSLSN